MTTVAIVGAGPLGRWLALAAARGGYRVLLEDVLPSNLRQAREALGHELGGQAIPNVNFVSTIEDAVRSADLAIDCVPDELESKLEIFCLLDRMAPPRTILVTPTTQQSITDLAACTYRPDRCIAVAVDPKRLAAQAGGELLIRCTTQTAPEVIALVRQFWEAVGFSPRVSQDQ